MTRATINTQHPGVVGEALKLQDLFLPGLDIKWLNFVLKMKILEDNVLILDRGRKANSIPLPSKSV